MGTAQKLVNRLLEADPDEVDPEAYLDTTTDPSARLARALRDELVERGWRHIRVEKMDTGVGQSRDVQWQVRARWIDGAWRAKCAAAGWRVTGSPERDWNLDGRIMSSFRGALKRLGIHILNISLEELGEVHQGIDLETLPDDFEDDPGDWRVFINFSFVPRAKFWSKLSQASPPDPPAPPQPPRKSLQSTDEPGEVQRESAKLRARLKSQGEQV